MGKSIEHYQKPIFDGTPYLGVIHSPDEQGAASNYEHNAINLGNNSAQGLPPFVQSFFNTVVLIPENTNANSDFVVCEGEPINLSPQFIAGATYTWAKDGNVIVNPDNYTYTIPSATLADAGTYTVTIVRPTAVQCPITGELDLVVDARPTFSDDKIVACDLDADDTTDGFTTIDLTQLENDTNLNYSYYQSIADRDNDQMINNPNTYRNIEPFDQSIYYKVTNNEGCIYEGVLETHVRESPIFSLEETYTICTDSPNLTIEGPIGFDIYNWIKIVDSQEELISDEIMIDIVEEGDYILEASINHIIDGEAISCSGRSFFKVLPSSEFEINDVVVNGDQLEIVVQAEGDYEFSLDGINYRESNVVNISEVNEFIFVRQKNGCIVMKNILEEYSLSDGIFPKFFTPNGDGINDFWQYIAPLASNGELELKSIYIFDRYGKLIYDVNPESNGWNGTYNSRPLPSSDYWYKAIFEGELLKFGHFTLKR